MLKEPSGYQVRMVFGKSVFSSLRASTMARPMPLETIGAHHRLEIFFFKKKNTSNVFLSVLSRREGTEVKACLHNLRVVEGGCFGWITRRRQKR